MNLNTKASPCSQVEAQASRRSRSAARCCASAGSVPAGPVRASLLVSLTGQPGAGKRRSAPRRLRAVCSAAQSKPGRRLGWERVAIRSLASIESPSVSFELGASILKLLLHRVLVTYGNAG